MEAVIDAKLLSEARRLTAKYEQLYGRWVPKDQILKVVEESMEVLDAIRNKNTKYGTWSSPEYKAHLLEEVADVFLSWITLVHIMGIKDSEIIEAIWKKLVVINDRVQKLEEEAENFSSGCTSEHG